MSDANFPVKISRVHSIMASVDPNRLFLDDDVDDEEFLRNSRGQSTNPFDTNYNQRQLYEQRRQEIEDRTLMSTERSLGLLHETEEVGAKTAEELARQREQLEKTSRQLDEINTTLRFSQKHLNGLKSVFGSLKNYISGQKDYSARMTQSSSASKINEDYTMPPPNQKTPEEQYNDHPINRLRSDNTQGQQQQKPNAAGSFNQRIENNLTDMSHSLSRLKHLAIDLNQEIVESNELIDNIHDKVENTDLKIGKQNKEMNKLLGKKGKILSRFDQMKGANQRLLYEERRKEIENRTLASTEKSLAMLYESEDIGTKTAEELVRQNEVLQGTSNQLDNINTTLKISQKHLKGIKSVFGGMRNFFSKKKEDTNESMCVDNTNISVNDEKIPENLYNNHPTTRLRNDNSKQGQQHIAENNSVDYRIQNNLVQISSTLNVLHDLSKNLNQEMDKSLGLIEKVNTKVENTKGKIDEQNREMKRILS
uniref:CSON003000 protein n=1 Tax=Culicoides sonorensis TaxID=179676 RepID=A0A336LW88_CULSO